MMCLVFFVSGPGINGTYGSPSGFPNQAINVAYFTDQNGVNLPITISSIHPGGNNCGTASLNAQHFISNVPNVDINFNGVTTIMTAKFEVTACDTYNIALAIGDGSDPSLNSAVFIEAKSFSSGQIEVNAKPSFNTFGNDSLLYEGCGQVELEFKRFSSLADSATVKFDITGNAINGTDYTLIADSINFPQGADISTLIFDVFDDGITEGTETLTIKIFPDTSYCFYNPSDTHIVNLYINDRPELVTSGINDTIVCNETFAEIGVGVVTGIPNYQYSWGTGDTVDTINVPVPLSDTMYIVTVMDACGVDTVVDTANIVLNIPPLAFTAENDTVSCPDFGNLSIQITSGTMPYSYSWSSGGTNSSISVSDTVTTWYYFTVSDNCNPAQSDSVAVVVLVEPLDYDDAHFEMDCILDSMQVFPDSISGNQPRFVWSTGDTVARPYVHPTQADTYFVTVTAGCVADIDTVMVTVDINYGDTLKIEEYLDIEIVCPNDTVELSALVTGGFTPYDYIWNTVVSPDSFNRFAAVGDSTMILSIEDACGTTVGDTAEVTLIDYVPLQLSLLTDGAFCVGRTGSITAELTGGAAPFSYVWNSTWPYVQLLDNELELNIQDTTNSVLVTVTDACGFVLKDSLELVSEVCLPNRPNIFTPNGDGINDLLYLIDVEQFPGTKLYVYNRWGELIYFSDDYRNNWDARNLNDGTYFYTLELFNGTKIQSYVEIIR